MWKCRLFDYSTYIPLGFGIKQPIMVDMPYTRPNPNIYIYIYIYDTKSKVKLGGFRFLLETSYVSSLVEEL